MRMALLAEKIVKEIDKDVDIFISPNDQMGSSKEFSEMIYKTSSKPLVGLAKEKGAAVAFGPDLEKNGKKLAFMIKEIFEGKNIEDLIPQSSESTIYIDSEIAKKFHLTIPENLH